MTKNQLRANKVADFKNLLGSQDVWPLVKTACGSVETAKQFTSSMLDLYEDGGDYLQDCDQMAIVRECLKAAQLHLPLIKTLGYAYVVPFKNKYGKKVPTFIIGWKGLVQLAQNTGKYRYINADAIYEGEEVETDRLSGQLRITGKPESDKAVGYFAYIELKNGYVKSLYMSRADMEAYGRKYSKAYDSGPWQTEFDAMARKTMLRKVLAYGPKSTEMMMAEAQEIKAAQESAQAEILRNGNTGPVIDVTDEPGETEGNGQEIPEMVETVVPDPGF